MNDAQKDTQAGAIAALAREATKPEIMSVCSRKGEPEVNVLLLRNSEGDVDVKELGPFTDKYLSAPRRRNGTAQLDSIDSFIDHTNRFKTGSSAIFLSNSDLGPRLTTVLNYHHESATTPDALPDFGDHRSFYKFPYSEEWLKWSDIDGKILDTLDFAEFIDERLIDIMPPNDTLLRLTEAPEPSEIDQVLSRMLKAQRGRIGQPEDLQELSQGIRVHSTEDVQHTIKIETGEAKLQISAVHESTTNRAGDKIDIPTMFLIGIPVFQRDARYEIPVRLRYRKRGDHIIWSFHMLRPDIFFDDATQQAGKMAAKATGLPLFYGAPETGRT